MKTNYVYSNRKIFSLNSIVWLCRPVIIQTFSMVIVVMGVLHFFGAWNLMISSLLFKPILIVLWELKFSPSKENTFLLLSIYLPASSHPIVDFREVLDLLWAVLDTWFQDGPVFLLGDFNADLGDSVGSRGTYPVSARGKLLLEFIHNFNMSPVNLASLQKAHSLHFGQKTESISLL